MKSQSPLLRLVPSEPAASPEPRNIGYLPELSRDEWLSRRAVGASDAATVLGENPYQTAHKLYLQKIGALPSTTESDAMKWGSLLEPLIASVWIAQSGLDARFNVVKNQSIFAHAEHDALTATPDYWVKKAGSEALIPLQIKTTAERFADQWVDAPPRHVWIQLQHEMAVTNADHAYVACLIGGQRLISHVVRRDDEFIDDVLIPRVVAFWDSVLARREPPLEASDKQTLSELYPVSRDEQVQLPPDAVGFIERYRRATADIAALERERDLAANCLKAMLGDCAEGICGSFKVSWKTEQRKAYTVQASSHRKFQIRGGK